MRDREFTIKQAVAVLQCFAGHSLSISWLSDLIARGEVYPKGSECMKVRKRLTWRSMMALAMYLRLRAIGTKYVRITYLERAMDNPAFESDSKRDHLMLSVIYDDRRVPRAALTRAVRYHYRCKAMILIPVVDIEQQLADAISQFDKGGLCTTTA